MLEVVLNVIGDELLEDELPLFQLGQHRDDHRVRLAAHFGHQSHLELIADDGERLEELLLISRQAIDTRRQDRLYVGRYLELTRRPGHFYLAVANQSALFKKLLNGLLDEKGIASSALHDQTPQRLNLLRIPQQSREHLSGALTLERLQTQLGVRGLVAPLVPILGAIVNQK